MHRSTPLLVLGLALLAPVVLAQPSKPDFPTTPNFPPKSHQQVLRHEPLTKPPRPEPAGDAERIKFSDPAKPGTFKLTLPWADVKITGTDGHEVVVRSSIEKKREKNETDADGFRRLDEDTSFELREKNNVVTVSTSGDEQGWFGPGAEFTVEVPRNTNLVLRSQLGGDIQVANLEGDIEITGMNGDVTLDQVAGSAVVNTMNGEVRVVYAKAPAKPVSITSMNGEIDVHLPGDTKANLRLRTHNGSIRTNFPESALVTKSERNTGRLRTSSIPGREAAAMAEDIARSAAHAARAQADQARVIAREQARVAQRAAAAAPVAQPAPAEMPEPAEAPEPPEAPEVPDTPALAPLPPLGAGFGGKSTVGTLNGGGVEISLSSMNGAITLRQVK